MDQTDRILFGGAKPQNPRITQNVGLEIETVNSSKSEEDLGVFSEYDEQFIEKLAKKSFDLIDSDKDGFITSEDFHKVIKDLSAGENNKQLPSKEECLYAFFSINCDFGSGISFDGWNSFIKQFFQNMRTGDGENDQELLNMVSPIIKRHVNRSNTLNG